jgi:hypothetical protein
MSLDVPSLCNYKNDFVYLYSHAVDYNYNKGTIAIIAILAW